MPRPSKSHENRARLLPTIARAFAELGYRRATTAQLARRCKVRENILYRLWPDKKAMFVAAIDYVYEQAAHTWHDVLQRPGQGSAAQRLLEHEARHYGESGLQRIVFAGLSETDEPEIRDALRNMYRRFHRFVRTQVAEHRNGQERAPDPAVTAWAIIGLGNLANASRELGLLSNRGRKRIFSEAGRLLLDGDAE